MPIGVPPKSILTRVDLILISRESIPTSELSIQSWQTAFLNGLYGDDSAPCTDYPASL